MNIHVHTGELNTCKHNFIAFSLQEKRRNKHEVRKKTTSVLLTSSDVVSDTWWARSIWGSLNTRNVFVRTKSGSSNDSRCFTVLLRVTTAMS